MTSRRLKIRPFQAILFRDLLELRNPVTVASLIVDCALTRRESRGLHFIFDHPESDDSRPPRETTMRRAQPCEALGIPRA